MSKETLLKQIEDHKLSIKFCNIDIQKGKNKKKLLKEINDHELSIKFCENDIYKLSE